MQRPTTASSVAVPRRAGLLTTLVLTMTVGTSLQFVVPILGPLILPDLGLSRAQLGMVTTTFFLVGAAVSPAAGRWCDRTGGRPTLVWTCLLGGSGIALVGAANGLPLLLLAGAVGGLGAALANPATNRLTLAGFPAGSRGLVVGLKQSGVQLGALVGGVVLPPLGLAMGWRTAAVLAGATGLVVLGLTSWLVPAGMDATRRTTSLPATERNPTITMLSAFAALMGFGIASVTTYLPVYAVEQVGVTVTRAGLATSLLAGLGICSRLSWGIAADRLGRPARALPILAAGATLGLFLLAGAVWLGPWALWLGAAVFGATALGWNGVAMLVAMTSVAPARVGWATGRVILAMFSGLVLSPIPFGSLADRTGSYLFGWIGLGVACALAAVVAAVSASRAPQRELKPASDR